MTVRGQNLEIMAAQLAGLGGRVEVVTPTVARDALARIGAELGALYGAARSGSRRADVRNADGHHG